MVRGDGWRGGTSLGTGTWGCRHSCGAGLAGVAGATVCVLSVADDWRRQQAWVKHRRQGTGVEGGQRGTATCRALGDAELQTCTSCSGRCLRTAQSVPKSTGYRALAAAASRLFPTSQPLCFFYLPSSTYSNNLIHPLTDSKTCQGKKNEAVHGRTRGWHNGE